MDLANQSKFKNGLIAVLLTVNLLTVSIIWMQTAVRNESQARPPGDRPPDSIGLLQKALDLNEEQTAKFQELRKIQLAPAKQYNDRQDELKLELAEELLNTNPDTALAKQKVVEIGEMQSRVEYIRFNHFRTLLALCSSEQREKLKPVIMELYTRKGPAGEGVDKRVTKRKPQGRRADDVKIEIDDRNPAPQPPPKQQGRQPRDRPEDGGVERAGPPAMEEKLSRLRQRLDLSEEQIAMVREILEAAKKDGEQSRKGMNPDSPEFEAEREKIRRIEDEGIMKILAAEQQKEYEKMITKRKK